MAANAQTMGDSDKSGAAGTHAEVFGSDDVLRFRTYWWILEGPIAPF